MLLWLPDAAGAASRLLSYFAGYDGAQGLGPIQDIAKNPNEAQKLIETSAQLSSAPLRSLPATEKISDQNTALLASRGRYRSIIPPPPDTGKPTVTRQVEDVYDDVVKITTKLEQLSGPAPLELTPFVALLAPLAAMFELALLDRLGSDWEEIRLKTAARYQAWFALLLSPVGVANSIASAVDYAAQQNDGLEGKLKSSILAPALAKPGSRQAVYCLEHQIGISDHAPFSPNKSLAELYNETWIRFYGVATIVESTQSDVLARSIGDVPEVEQYARVALTDRWYGPKPPWGIPVDSYDSRNIQGFRGQSHVERVRDIQNSAKWRAFLTGAWPQACSQLPPSNEARLYLKFVADVFNSIKAAAMVVR
jgi:hypothetical protein